MLLENGIWISTDTPPQSKSGAALFLDRDGVVIRDTNYISRTEDVTLEHGIVELLQWACEAGHSTIIVTNQSGIARGMFGWAEFEAVHKEMTRQLREADVSIDLTIACPFHPDFSIPYTADMQTWRKPGSAMLTYAADVLNCDRSSSWMIGDVANDMQAAKLAGLKGGIHVLTGHGQRERADALALSDSSFHVEGLADLLAAVDFLTRNMASSEPHDGFKK